MSIRNSRRWRYVLICAIWYLMFVINGVVRAGAPWWAWCALVGVCVLTTIAEIKVLNWWLDWLEVRKSRR